MPRTRRLSQSAPYFHVLNRSVRRTPLFFKPLDYRAFLTVMREGLARYPVQLLAYCVMPNHWHLVLEPEGTRVLASFMQWVTATHALRWHRHRRTLGEGHVYQGRYHAKLVEFGADLVRVCRYVERNALQAQLVKRAQDWPWCSLYDRCTGSTRVPLRSARFLASQAWIDYVNADGSSPLDHADEFTRVVAMEPPRYPVATTGVSSGTEMPEPVEKSNGPLVGEAAALVDAAEPPRALARGRERRQHMARAVLAAHQDQPHAHVEGAEHLVVRNPARALQPVKDRRDRPAAAVK
jgi:REP element-mobilizing transposase RayT